MKGSRCGYASAAEQAVSLRCNENAVVFVTSAFLCYTDFRSAGMFSYLGTDLQHPDCG